MIDADWNATQCLAGSISYCRVGCIPGLISFLTGVTLYVWSYVNPSGGGHMRHQASVGISMSASDIVLCGVEVQGYSGNMIPFVMFNYQLTPHLSLSSTLFRTRQHFMI